MKKLKAKSKLSFILPKMTNDNKKIDYSKILTSACNVFGGYTLRECSGGWVDNNTLYTDESNELEILHEGLNEDMKNTVEEILNFLFSEEEAGQLAVYANNNNEVYILENEDVKEFKNIL